MSHDFDDLFKNYEEKVKVINENYLDLGKLIENLNNYLAHEKKANEKLIENMKKFKPVESEIVKFNIGGQIFSTFKSTITKRIRKRIQEKQDENDNEIIDEEYYHSNLLDGLLNGLVEIKYDDNNAIFIDRNPKYFGYILDYLREANSDSEFDLPETKDNYKALLKDAEYYDIEGLKDLINSKIKPGIDSAILNQNQVEELIKISGFPITDKWRLLYRGTRDGFGSSTFHSKVDNHPNTLVIIKSNYNNIFGGYADLTWNHVGGYKDDPGAFLYSLVNKENIPYKLHYNQNGNALYCHSGYGPTFGSGHDLLISNNSNVSGTNYSNLGSSYTHPNYSYSSVQAQAFLAGSYYFNVVEIEVYTRN